MGPTSLSCNTNNKKTKNSNNNDRLIFFPTPLKLNRTKSLNNTSIDSSFDFNAQESEIKLAKPIFSAQESEIKFCDNEVCKDSDMTKNGIKTINNDKHSNNTVASSEKKIKSSSSSSSTLSLLEEKMISLEKELQTKEENINNLQKELNKSKEMNEQLEKYYLEKYNDERRDKTETSIKKIPQTKSTLEEKITLLSIEKNTLQLEYEECLNEIDIKLLTLTHELTLTRSS